MGTYNIEITTTLPGAPSSRKISSTVKAKDIPSAIALMISGVWADSGRSKTVIWYRDFARPTYPKGYYRSEKRLLISAIRADAAEAPGVTEFPPKWRNKKIRVTKVAEAEPAPVAPPPKRRRPVQLDLFDKITVDGSSYVLAADPTADNEAPYGKLDPSKVDELARIKPTEVVVYAKFYRIFSSKALAVLEQMKPTSTDPMVQDAWQAQIRTLRDNDAWILSNRKAVSQKPVSAVLGTITVVDLPQMTARQVEGYVDGVVAYVPVDKAFVGAPPLAAPGGGQPSM